MPNTADNPVLRIYVAIITLGRPAILRQTVDWLSRQSRQPDGIIVVGTTYADVAGVCDSCPQTHVVFTHKGTCRQRNVALDLLVEKADIVIFMDDDFVPARDYIAKAEQLMRDDPALVGLTGQLIRDGAQSAEVSFEQAIHDVQAIACPDAASHDCTWLYGCNMVVRLTAAPALRFDEHLPLYGWQEDVDYSSRLARFGRMIRSRELTGVHLGTRAGRTSGLRFGYSQVANIFYLRRKHTISWRHGFGLMTRNIVANVARSLWPEPEIDRRGRLAGNVLALSDRLHGRVDPMRIETF
jgi:GT2 family glycosyltransferase